MSDEPGKFFMNTAYIINSFAPGRLELKFRQVSLVKLPTDEITHRWMSLDLTHSSYHCKIMGTNLPLNVLIAIK